MRGLLNLMAAFVVIGLAYWAYQQNFETQQALKRVHTLQGDIAAARDRLGVLRAEWAYLNRPERLRELAELNDARLGLMPLSDTHFGETGEIGFRPLPTGEISAPVDVFGPYDLSNGDQEGLAE